ncbi:hypothetical protein KIPE111705_34745 [Kibdelosporangium persicum]|uniref:WXG100 family type VII secretion target n=1 Tax=Kibdelosporangium persicum TaxID=2698649 RepID=A0ABX2F013_9PSEU|nr:hypothetical protein [Kibdelosporangium persicum]NRN64567.1 hypothetical protein [Kibdelosporangium persicum]
MSDLAALSAPMKPVDALHQAGLGSLSTLVGPLQGVLDRMAGNTQVVQAFTQAWTGAAQHVEQVRRRLAEAATDQTNAWRGVAADGYRARAARIAAALGEFAATAKTAADTVDRTAAAVAAGRSAANDLLTDLVRRLISLAQHIMAAQGGMTATVLAQASELVTAYVKPLAALERQVQDTVTSAAGSLAGPTAKLDELARLWQSHGAASTTVPADTRSVQPVRVAEIIPHDRPAKPTDPPHTPGRTDWTFSRNGWAPTGHRNSPDAIFHRVPEPDQARYTDWLRKMTAAGISPRLASMALSFTPPGTGLPVVGEHAGTGVIGLPSENNPAHPVVGREIVNVDGRPLEMVHRVADAMKAAADNLTTLGPDRHELWIQIPGGLATADALREVVMRDVNAIMMHVPDDQYERIQRLQVGFFHPDGTLVGSLRHEGHVSPDTTIPPESPLRQPARFPTPRTEFKL